MSSPNKRNSVYLPDIPKEQWSDFRVDYESGMTMKEIASKYYCDPRTVSSALSLNRGSSDFSKRIQPKKLEPHEGTIAQLVRDTTEYKSLLKLSRRITAELQKEGYSGGERTVRNYLQTRPDVKALSKAQQKKTKEVSDDQH